MENTHLLDDLEYTYTQASSNKRFINYLIDRVAFYLVYRVMFALFLRPIAFVLYSTTRDKNVISIEVIVIALIMFVVFFTVCEGFSRGKTLGKWITGTRVVTADGGMIT